MKLKSLRRLVRHALLGILALPFGFYYFTTEAEADLQEPYAKAVSVESTKLFTLLKQDRG